MQDVFARAVEAARLTLGFTLFPTQIRCAQALLEGRIVEMQTGEGKTLAAMPAAAVLAQTGLGVHVLTANDYLAQRDAEWMGPAYRHLGLRAAWIRQASTEAERREAYAADVTYIAATEAGFDHLRDCRALTRAERVQRSLHAALIDEADSVLIDEARIPLVLAGETEGAIERAQAAARAVEQLQPRLHFVLNTMQPDVQLTDAGLAEVELLLGNVYDNMPLLTAVYHAIRAHRRLVLLLDQGSTPAVRKAAAQQIGEIQQLHPHELQPLLFRLLEFLRNTSWETRIAAAQAVEAIAKHVPQWNGKEVADGDAAAMEVDQDAEMEDLFSFGNFDVNRVITFGKPLLASEGLEYDPDPELETMSTKVMFVALAGELWNESNLILVAGSAAEGEAESQASSRVGPRIG